MRRVRGREESDTATTKDHNRVETIHFGRQRVVNRTPAKEDMENTMTSETMKEGSHCRKEKHGSME